MKRLLGRGQGPNEFILPIHIGEAESGHSVIVLERSVSRFSFFDKDSLIAVNNPQPFFRKKINQEGLDPVVLHNRYYLATCGENNFFLLYDSLGGKCFEMVDYPPMLNDMPAEFKKQAYQGTLKVSSDGKSIVLGGLFSDYLTFLSFNGDTLKVKKSYQSYLPDVLYKGEGMPFGFGPNFCMAYFTISVTEQYVYALYDGQKKSHKKGERADYCMIYQFDWDGNPIQSFETHPFLLRFTVDEKNNTLWGIDFDLKLYKTVL